ncbi:MAG: hypothetical protein JW704_04505 [Anaerolineaceae bacterium]|nr:hypothetical protein [Anaerolineaceae bacterium]
MSYIKVRILCFILLIALIFMPLFDNAAEGASFLDSPKQQENRSDNATADSWLGMPAYDSDWLLIGPRPDPVVIPVTHNLGGNINDYMVTLMCLDDTSLGTYNCIDNGFNYNVHWHALTNTGVNIYVIGGTKPDYVRVRIYMPTPLFDSGWQAIGVRPDPLSWNIVHNLGGNSSDYLVDLQWQYGSLGIYDCIDDAMNVNAFWHKLTNVSISTFVSNVRPDDVRVRIFNPHPAYDSGWTYLGTVRPDPGVVIYTHNLGGNVDDYHLDLQCWDTSADYQAYNCNNFAYNNDSNWYGLDETTAYAYIAAGSQPDYVRLRIWTKMSFYLPIIVK